MPSNVKQIVVDYLKANGYDGLRNDNGECACDLSDLAPCYNNLMYCYPGYKHKCGGCDDYSWCIGISKDAECWRDDAD